MTSRTRVPGRPVQVRKNAPGDAFNPFDAVEFRDRRVARAVYGLPWEDFGTVWSSLTVTRACALVRMLEALELRGSESVLDIGTGAAYRAALLGSLASRVRSVELASDVAALARARLGRLGYENVEVASGDGSLGWELGTQYQAILVGCAAPNVPNELIDQLDEGGHLVIPVGDAKGQLILRLCRRGNSVESTTIAACALRPLAFREERVPSVPWLQLPTG
jgi:protein-L-isoaspartate(D-aspartate) O-methyltransferase